MTWNSNLTNLRDILADLYFTVQDSRQVVEEAGLQPSFIEFSNKAVTNWHNILRYAQKRHKVQSIIEVAQKDYPENQFLTLAKENGLTAVRGIDIEDQVNWQAEEDADQLEKIMGRQSTFLPISFLENGYKKAHSVVRVLRGDQDSGSGFVIDNNLLITNNHVLPTEEEAAKAIIQFNYQQSITGLDAPISEFNLGPEEIFFTSKQNDWTVVKVQGNANAKWGAIKLTHTNIQKKDRVIIIQHPGGGPKQIALYHNIIVFADESRVQYLTDTLPGSSGSPVFDNEWRVVALHHSGGWLREPGSKQKYYRNEGIHINVVIDGLIEAGLYTVS
jgi:V8-like Glu-specific endopeptidase